MSRHTIVRYPELRDLLEPVFAQTKRRMRGNNLRNYVLHFFAERGEPISRSTLGFWIKGNFFPVPVCQSILAEALGSEIGGKLMALKGSGIAYAAPPRGKPKEEVMARPKRIYPVHREVGEDGKLRAPFRITCAKCGEVEDFSRTGKMEPDEYFRSKGWETDHHEDRDRCPTCVGLRKPKLVASSVEQAVPAPVEAREMSKEDGRLVFKAIEAHWNDHKDVNAYLPGWSDGKLAEAEGVPVDWIRTIRERDFGGSGDDPAITRYIAEHLALEKQFGMVTAGMQELSASVAIYSRELAAAKQKIEAELGRYRDRHNMLAERVKKLGETARGLQPPDETKAAG